MPMAGTFKNASGTKAGTQSLPTPMPMSVNAATEAEIDGPADYKSQVNGIVPGYSGHVPRARDKYAASAHGGIAPERGPHVAKGPQTGHVRPEDVLPPHFVDYVEKSRGVMPGYCGFRPESVHVKNVSAYGGIPHQGMRDSAANAGIGLNFGVSSDEGPGQLQQGNRGGAVDNCSANLSHNGFEFRRAQDVTDDPPSFRDNVGGVLPGYTGHVPRSNEKHGVSHYGGLSPDKPYVPMAQTGHEGYKVSAPGQPIGQAGEKDVELNMIPGYQGFIPKMRDAFGTSVYTKGR